MVSFITHKWFLFLIYHFIFEARHNRSCFIGECNQIDEIIIAECIKYGWHCCYGQFKWLSRHWTGSIQQYHLYQIKQLNMVLIKIHRECSSRNCKVKQKANIQYPWAMMRPEWTNLVCENHWSLSFQTTQPLAILCLESVAVNRLLNQSIAMTDRHHVPNYLQILDPNGLTMQPMIERVSLK